MDRLDLTNKRFGMLKALKFHETKEYGTQGRKKTMWLCECECSKMTSVAVDSLITGTTTSCGCKRSTRNGISKGPLARLWRIHNGMMNRCYSKNNIGYRNYGGRGITVYRPWHDVNTFYRDVKRRYTAHVRKHGEANTTLDRINNNGNYHPVNIRWSTRHQQASNTRNIVKRAGVYQSKQTGSWIAVITVNKKAVSLGSHPTFRAAVSARKAYEKANNIN